MTHHNEALSDRVDSPEVVEEYLLWDQVGEAFRLSPLKRESLQGYIQDFFTERHIDSLDIENIHRNESENFIIIQAHGVEYYFDIYSETFCGNILNESIEARNHNPGEEIGIILSGVPVLQTLMEHNSQSGWLYDHINEGDTVDFDAPEIFRGLSARELQMTIRQNIQIFERKGGLMGISESQRRETQIYYTQYLEIVMGIGEVFEEGAGQFYITGGEADIFIQTTVYSMANFSDAIQYYIDTQTQIYNNRRTSKNNKQAHQIFSQKLGTVIFERFQRELEQLNNQEDRDAFLELGIRFIEVITERSEVDINNDLRNPQLASEICVYIISRQNGFIESIENCTPHAFEFNDPVVGDRVPLDVIGEVRSELSSIGISHPDSFLRDNLQISLLGLIQPENISSYRMLSMTHKREISILARFLNKIRQGDFSPERLAGMSEQEIQQELTQLSQDIYSEAMDAVLEAYDRNFELRFVNRPDFRARFPRIARDLGVGEYDIRAFELFNDIRGNGGDFDFSDETHNLAQSLAGNVGVIITSIAVIMIATAATGGFAMTGVIPSLVNIAANGQRALSLAGSLTSIGVGATLGTAANIGFIDPRRHDSRSEMISDLISDFGINTLHAIYMERLILTLGHQLSTGGRSSLIGLDLSSGIGIEYAREAVLDRIFHSEPMLGEWQSNSLDEAFWGLNYQAISDASPQFQERFQNATQIYHMWNSGALAIQSEPEFQGISWERESMLNALERWIERQEARMII